MFSQIWDVLLFVMLLPVVTLMGLQLPGDIAHHRGLSLPGTATVTGLERGRGEFALVDVSSEAGQVVASRQEIAGDVPKVVGATVAVRYLPVDRHGYTQVYVAGHDPLAVNLAVLIPCLLVWLTALLFLGVRLLRLATRALRHFTPRRTGTYRAGRGYCD